MYKAEPFRLSEELLDVAATISTTNNNNKDGRDNDTPSLSSTPSPSTLSSPSCSMTLNKQTRLLGLYFTNPLFEEAFVAYTWCSRSKVAVGCWICILALLVFLYIRHDVESSWMYIVDYPALIIFILIFLFDAGCQFLDKKAGFPREQFLSRCKRCEGTAFGVLFTMTTVAMITQYGSRNTCVVLKRFNNSIIRECHRDNAALYWGVLVLFQFLAARTIFMLPSILWALFMLSIGRLIEPPLLDSERELWPKIVPILTFSAGCALLQTFRERNSRHFFLVEVTIIQNSRIAIQKKNAITAIVAKMLPRQVLHRIGAEREKLFDNDIRKNASLLQFDVVNFTKWCSTRTPAELVDMMSQLVTKFDAETFKLGVEKLKTIGDAYQATSGLLESTWGPVQVFVHDSNTPAALPKAILEKEEEKERDGNNKESQRHEEGDEGTTEVIDHSNTKTNGSCTNGNCDTTTTLNSSCPSSVPSRSPPPQFRDRSAIGLFYLANSMHRVVADTRYFPDWCGRIGIATGPLLGTIIGSEPYRYDAFGDAAELVNVLEPSCTPEHTLLCAASKAQIVAEHPELINKFSVVDVPVATPQATTTVTAAASSDTLGHLVPALFQYCDGDDRGNATLLSRIASRTKMSSPNENEDSVASADVVEDNPLRLSGVNTFDTNTMNSGSTAVAGSSHATLPPSQTTSLSQNHPANDDEVVMLVTDSGSGSTGTSLQAHTKNAWGNNNQPFSKSEDVRCDDLPPPPPRSRIGSGTSLEAGSVSFSPFGSWRMNKLAKRRGSRMSGGGVQLLGTSPNPTTGPEVFSESKSNDDFIFAVSAATRMLCNNNNIEFGHSSHSEPNSREISTASGLAAILREGDAEDHVLEMADDDLFFESKDALRNNPANNNLVTNSPTSLRVSSFDVVSTTRENVHEERGEQDDDDASVDNNQQLQRKGPRSGTASPLCVSEGGASSFASGGPRGGRQKAVRIQEADENADKKDEKTEKASLLFESKVGFRAALISLYVCAMFYVSCLVSLGLEDVMIVLPYLAIVLAILTLVTIPPIIVTHMHQALYPKLNLVYFVVTQLGFHLACAFQQGATVSNTLAYSVAVYGVIQYNLLAGNPLRYKQVVLVFMATVQLLIIFNFRGVWITSFAYVIVCNMAIFLINQENHAISTAQHEQVNLVAMSVDEVEAETLVLESVLKAIMPAHVVPDLLHRIQRNSVEPIVQSLEHVGIGFLRINSSHDDHCEQLLLKKKTKKKVRAPGLEEARSIRRVLFTVEGVMSEFKYLLVIKTVGNVLMVGSCLSAAEQAFCLEGLLELFELPQRLHDSLNFIKRHHRRKVHKKRDNIKKAATEQDNEGNVIVLQQAVDIVQEAEDTSNSSRSTTTSSVDMSYAELLRKNKQEGVAHGFLSFSDATVLNINAGGGGARIQASNLNLLGQVDSEGDDKRMSDGTKSNHDTHHHGVLPLPPPPPAPPLPVSESPQSGTPPPTTTILHCGIHYGPVTTAVMGVNQLLYDVFGTTVNGASRVLSVGCSPVTLQHQRNEGTNNDDCDDSSTTSLLPSTLNRNSEGEKIQRVGSIVAATATAVEVLSSNFEEWCQDAADDGSRSKLLYQWSQPFSLQAKGLGGVDVCTADVS